MRLRPVMSAALGALLLSACSKNVPAEKASAPSVEAPAPKPAFDSLSRLDFNLRAAERYLPLFWREDANRNGALDPAELVVLWGYGSLRRDELVEAGGFTPRFAELYRGLQRPWEPGTLPPEEARRREAVLRELTQGKPTLVETRLPDMTGEERAILEHVSRAAALVDRLYSRQAGSLGLEADVPADDTASRMLFHRNQGSECVAPKTERDPDCSALPERPRRVSGLYPADSQADPAFCDMLARQPNAKELMDHFSVVVANPAKKGAFQAVPYHVAYREDMEAVAGELEAAAAAITSPGEAAFKAYLLAAARAFRTNDWESANEAWAAMGADNSKWYLRIAPDEVYYDPCAWKAGFAVSFARINPDSVAWQKKLEPVKVDMEKALAALAGPPYRARNVGFKLPDFIDIVLNGGDARDPHGATVGQSLPNWGAVAARGGRTVAMTNLYTDADSLATLGEQMASLFCPETNARTTTENEPGLLGFVLHEAAHNLGPSHEYKVRGKEDDVVFGGPLAATLEELKAQTAALYFFGWLQERGLLTSERATQGQVRGVAWALGHISRGMYAANGSPRTYSQVSAIQMGFLREAGVLVWEPERRAANGQDTGCFQVHLEKWKPAVDDLARQVLQIKSRGDRKAAEAMKVRYVDDNGEWERLRGIITERWLRAPRATFVYALPQ